MMTDLAVILLAAGESRRMGSTNKLLLEFDGEALLRRSARMLAAQPGADVTVVLGHAADQAAAVISKVRCSFLLPSTQPSPIPEESEGPFSPATPVAAETPKGKPDVPESASGGAEASSSARAAATPDVGGRPPADGAEPSPAPSDPSQAASAAAAAIEQLRVVKAALAESEEARP